MGFPLFLKKILQYRFGIDANEFLSKSTIEEVNIAGMNTKAVVHHREMMDTPGLKTIDRQHHVCGIQENERGERRCHPLASSSRSSVFHPLDKQRTCDPTS